MPDDVALPEGAEVVLLLPEVPPALETPAVWERLAELGRWAETQPSELPVDLAQNHDHYLHGRPKRS